VVCLGLFGVRMETWGDFCLILGGFVGRVGIGRFGGKRRCFWRRGKRGSGLACVRGCQRGIGLAYGDR
jgi:hypothetical protein